MLKRIIKILLLLGLVYWVYFLYGWKSSVDEIKRVCGEIEIGQNRQAVIDTIMSSRYLRYVESGDRKSPLNQILILSSANRGRHTCYVAFDGEVVVKSELSYAD